VLSIWDKNANAECQGEFVKQETLLRLDLDLVARLIRERFEDKPNALRDAWPLKTPSGKSAAPDRVTIWRWLTGKKFPRNVDELYGLAGALDVDPMALLALAEGMTWSELCRATREYHWDFRLAPKVARFWFLYELIRMGLDWPSSAMSQRYFQREWQKKLHSHRASVKRNYYGRFLFELDKDSRSQVWHFAWRSHADKPWRPYGFVRREESSIHLCSFEGFESTASLGLNASFIVKTWFGKKDAEFCVASLHPVKCTLAEGSTDEPAVVRFDRSPVQPLE
jgi:hypothetical protein